MINNTLVTSIVVGFIASITFILIQPLFGLATLTSRHAGAYINLGSYSETFALVLSWFVHISVSIAYAFISTIIFNLNNSLLVSFIQIMFLGWFTTLIATPANEWVVKLVTTEQFTPFGDLAPLNTEIGAKFWLHILFFIFVVAILWLKKVNINSK